MFKIFFVFLKLKWYRKYVLRNVFDWVIILMCLGNNLFKTAVQSSRVSLNPLSNIIVLDNLFRNSSTISSINHTLCRLRKYRLCTGREGHFKDMLKAFLGVIRTCSPPSITSAWRLEVTKQKRLKKACFLTLWIVKLGSWSISNLNLITQKRTRADVII